MATPTLANLYLAAFLLAVVAFAYGIVRLSLRDDRHTPKALRVDEEAEEA